MKTSLVRAGAWALAMQSVAFVAGCEVHVGNKPAPATPPPPPPAAAPAPLPAPVKPVANAEVEGDKVKIPGELAFDLDKATLRTTPESTQILATLIEFLKQNPQVTKLRIEGHTDDSGSAEHNQTLSQERAESVVKYLTEHGVERARLAPQGFGAGRPLVANDTPEHKAQNRRTEFHVAAINGADIGK